MRKFKVCLAVLLVAMMMGGSVWAYDLSDHVKIAPNGRGDLLFFPWFFAMDSGYSTTITVINTSATDSVVAKVVYRSYDWSQELLDHLIYLSPNDVWTATIAFGDGTARLYCNDDSMLSRAVAVGGKAVADDFANKTPVTGTDGKLGRELVAIWCPNDSNTMGYVEIIESAAMRSAGKTLKTDIWDWYEKITTSDIINTYPPVNVLTGYQENLIGSAQTLKQATVLADYGNRSKLSATIATYIGENADNTLAEVEAAISKSDVALPYVASEKGDQTLHIFNFPTKQSVRSSRGCGDYVGNWNSPYWFNTVWYKCAEYDVNLYDLMENTPVNPGLIFSPVKTSTKTMCEEVHFDFIKFSTALSSYTEGWIRYNWSKGPVAKSGFNAAGMPFIYTGTPVLASALYWTDSGFNWAEANAAYKDGEVSYYDAKAKPTEIKYYQYADFANLK